MYIYVHVAPAEPENFRLTMDINMYISLFWLVIYIMYSGLHPLRDRKEELLQRKNRGKISEEIQKIYSPDAKDAKSEEEPENEENVKKDKQVKENYYPI
jgi:hypothetical protein